MPRHLPAEAAAAGHADIDVPLGPGVSAFIGRNGQGKTNLVEAIDYLARLSSHRVAGEAPLIRARRLPGRNRHR